MRIKAPAGGFGAIMADFPWHTRTWSSKGETSRSPNKKYRTMTIEQGCRMGRMVKRVASKDCWLFFWTTGTHLEQAFRIIHAWGFTYSSTAFIWVKLGRRLKQVPMFIIMKDFKVGLGKTTRKNVEICLLARRGRARRKRKDIQELIVEPTREHSRKPEEARRRIELFCTGPYLEMFARAGERENWTMAGDQVGTFK